MSIPAAGLYTMETVAAPNTRLSNSISCVKKPVFGRIEGRLDFRCANALLRGILSCFMRYARHREADRLTPDTQCTSVLPPADRTCITKHVLLVNGAVCHSVLRSDADSGSWQVCSAGSRYNKTGNAYTSQHGGAFELPQLPCKSNKCYCAFETWWHMLRNQISSFAETDESI